MGLRKANCFRSSELEEDWIENRIEFLLFLCPGPAKAMTSRRKLKNPLLKLSCIDYFLMFHAINFLNKVKYKIIVVISYIC